MLAPHPRHQAAPASGLGIGSGAGKQIRSAIGQYALHRVFTGVETIHQLQQPHRLQFIHRPGPGLVTGPQGVTGETEQVADPKGMGAEQVSLQGQTVAVPAGHLQHRFQAVIKQQAADRQTAHAHHGTAAVGDIDGMNQAPQDRRRLKGAGGLTAARRRDLGSDRKLSPSQGLSEPHASSRFGTHHGPTGFLE